MKKISIIILNYNNYNVTTACVRYIDSIKSKLFTIDTIIVDGCSSDNSYALLRKKYKNKKVIGLKQNLGFGGSVNIGIKIALRDNPDYIMPINNDIVLTRTILEALYKLHEKYNKAGVISPVLKYKVGDKTMYNSGTIKNYWGRPIHQISNERPLPILFNRYTTPGASIMVKSEIFNKNVFFDKNFFLYFEDDDFCLQIKNLGYDILVDGNTVVIHGESTTVGWMSKKKFYFVTKSGHIFADKHVKNLFLNILFKTHMFFQSMWFVITRVRDISYILCIFLAINDKGKGFLGPRYF